MYLSHLNFKNSKSLTTSIVENEKKKYDSEKRKKSLLPILILNNVCTFFFRISKFLINK